MTEESMNILKSRGMRFGTKTERALLDALGSPDEDLEIVHIAGTNGKGSVAEYVASCLRCAGKKVGCFTSPAVYDETDMYSINCESAKRDMLEKTLDSVYNIGEKKGIFPTLFEVQTAAALVMFLQNGCEYAVLECGMGGRDDATNAVRGKRLAIVTPVSLEHAKYLGDSVKEICEKKAAIAESCPLLVSCGQSEEAIEVFARFPHATFAADPENVRDESNGTSFSYRGRKFFVKARGYAAAACAATAIEAADFLGLDFESIREGVESASIRGRVEVIERGGVSYVLDGAHNPAAFVPLAGFLKGKGAVAIYGRLSDKDAAGCMKTLKGADISKLYVVATEGPRAADLDETLSVCKEYFEDAEAATMEEALGSVKSGYVAVCGSFALLKEAKNWIETKQ